MNESAKVVLVARLLLTKVLSKLGFWPEADIRSALTHVRANSKASGAVVRSATAVRPPY